MVYWNTSISALWLLFGLVTWNGAKMWAVTFNLENLIFTSASHNVKKDPAIVDHLFMEVFLVLNLFVHTNESWMIDALAPLSIKIFIYLEVLHTSFGKMLIVSGSFLCILSSWIDSSKVIGTASSFVEY